LDLDQIIVYVYSPTVAERAAILFQNQDMMQTDTAFTNYGIFRFFRGRL
jgi:hypothetical protein